MNCISKKYPLNCFVDFLTQVICDVVVAKNACHLVFPGGNTPKPIFSLLKFQDLPWAKLHLYPSDERCVPIHSPERNDMMIEELLFPFVPLPEENLHRIPAELGPTEGALVYREVLAQTPPFDIAWVGVGEDGHIASLFPDSCLLDEPYSAGAVYNSPKPPSERVTIGMSYLKQAKERWVIIAGDKKRHIYTTMQKNSQLPLARFNPNKIFI